MLAGLVVDAGEKAATADVENATVATVLRHEFVFAPRVPPRDPRPPLYPRIR